MARKKKHEEHVNAEAWAIPYGDLVTLLFALFTVMYAVSSVNEGKFRVLSDSMIAAFHGAPKSMQPINIGQKQAGKGGEKELVGVSPTALMKIRSPSINVTGALEASNSVVGKGSEEDGAGGGLIRMERKVQEAMKSLIDAKQVTVKRENMWLKIEINTDILFPSGAGAFSSSAQPVLDKLAEVLKPFPNPIRVEGHTDDRPIRTAAFPSNWELSAARSASVVHQFMGDGIDPSRLEIVGFGEYRPKLPNDSVEGRNANRRVSVLVLEELEPDTGRRPTGATTADAHGAADGAADAAHGAAVAQGPADAAHGAADAQGAADAHGSVGAAPAPAPAPASGVDPTVPAKNQGKAVHPSTQHMRPVEVVWSASGPSEAKAPPPKHE